MMSYIETIVISGRSLEIVSIPNIARRFGVDFESIPYSIRILIENVARQGIVWGNPDVSESDVQAIVNWKENIGIGLPLFVERVIFPDSSGIPALMDLAALRDSIDRAGGSVDAVEPKIPVDVVVDHSLQVDWSGRRDAVILNERREIERNAERYRFLKWASGAFRGITVHPPGSGIIHQLNLEVIAEVVRCRVYEGRTFAVPDFVIGGDSHTPMVNGIGVLGWGVGGIDAEAAMLGSSYQFPVPRVTAVRLTGRLQAGVTTTDMILTMTQRLRSEGVAGDFVEYVGEGALALSVSERASLANMAPEYGATCGYFPIDRRTVEYIGITRSDPELPALVEGYCRANGLFRDENSRDPEYTRVVEFDMGTVEPSVAGPKRPQDRLSLRKVASDFRSRLTLSLSEGGFGANASKSRAKAPAPSGDAPLRHGSIVIAAITSCTNTSNPRVMLAAGILARNARKLGITPPSHVKTSLAPGSHVVTGYLGASGLLSDLEQLGFHIVGYGCTTCGGKSGPIREEIAKAIEDEDLVVSAVLSGNRNFEGRIHRQVRSNYIMSPPLVVAYALAGRIDIDLTAEPLGRTAGGREVFLSDIWPSEAELDDLEPAARRPQLYRDVYHNAPSSSAWSELPSPDGLRYAWQDGSNYLLRPPFFDESCIAILPDEIVDARVLGAFGDSLTTDHISPGGEIPLDSPAGKYLTERGVAQSDFNTYVSRRGNHDVMARATFANIRLKNLLVPEREGWWTRDPVNGETVSFYEAAQRARLLGTPLIVLAGSEYGTGSSRDWAAKGSLLLGLRIVLAESFERIHRSNLIGMGILPLIFPAGQGWRQLGLNGSETFSFRGIASAMEGGGPVRVEAASPGLHLSFDAMPAVLNKAERRQIARGGILAATFSDLVSNRADR